LGKQKNNIWEIKVKIQAQTNIFPATISEKDRLSQQ